jgi:uncharacterized Zn finger protein
MSCPTCSHTLGRLCVHEGMAFAHCERCGTVTVTILDANPGSDNPRVYVPKLVERCREFERIRATLPTVIDWKRLGIAESIRCHEDRP